jgi:PTH1 family peptidyl-tRNA hydrolase
MTWIIVGLGNPGEEYKNTRHNTGRMIATDLGDDFGVSEWKFDKKLSAEVGKGEIDGTAVKFILPDTFMNLSGKAVKPLIGTIKAAEKLIVIHDDMDLPIGTLKISFGKGSGGHRGLDSIIKAVKTKDFVRLRIGISPTTPSGKLKKPKGEEAVIKFILGTFKKPESDELKKVAKRAKEAASIIVNESKEKAMSTIS